MMAEKVQAAGVEAGSPLRALIAKWRAEADQHDRETQGGATGDIAAIWVRRCANELESELEALLSAPVASARYENAQCVTCGKDLDTEEETQARLSAPVASDRSRELLLMAVKQLPEGYTRDAVAAFLAAPVASAEEKQ
jgi:hypothetical protein